MNIDDLLARSGGVCEICGSGDALERVEVTSVGDVVFCAICAGHAGAPSGHWRALEGVGSVGITAGASAPEVLIDEVVDAFHARFDVTVEPVVTAEENIEFKVPRVLREPA